MPSSRRSCTSSRRTGITTRPIKTRTSSTGIHMSKHGQHIHYTVVMVRTRTRLSRQVTKNGGLTMAGDSSRSQTAQQHGRSQQTRQKNQRGACQQPLLHTNNSDERRPLQLPAIPGAKSGKYLPWQAALQLRARIELRTCKAQLRSLMCTLLHKFPGSR